MSENKFSQDVSFPVDILQSSMDALRISMNHVVSSMTETMQSIDLSGIAGALEDAASRMLECQREIIASGAMTSALEAMYDQLRDNLSSSLSSVVDDLLPYTTPEQREDLEQVVPNICEPEVTETAKPRRLTFDQIVALISLLITMLGYVQQQLPDPQLEAINKKLDTLAVEMQETNERLENIEQFTIGGNHFSCEIADPANNGLNVSDPSTEPENREAVEDAGHAQQ